ncbi:MAG: mRNA interferase YafQ [Candidatus Azotimanducaceae bacterium]|jgi:mRNA interferase YafQ
MQYRVLQTKKFLKALRRVKQNRSFKPDRLKDIVRLLSYGEELSHRYHDHQLHGDMFGYRECHLAPDILLIYEIDEDIVTLTLLNIGKHSKLFK